MKLSSFILVLCCILSLVFGQLPRTCKTYKETLNKADIVRCNKIHFSENLNNIKKCPIGTKARPLIFKWEVTYGNYTLDDKDESTRPVYKINGIFPPPAIHAIKGDWVLIPVINNIKKPANDKGKCGEFTTIHWHGITMRTVERWDHTIVPGTPFMDGVPGINQCPIPGCDQKDKNRLDYFFQLVDSGTYWYHSHYETQVADGLSGPIIVKDCDDSARFKYDESDDVTIAVSDWFKNTTAEEAFGKYKYSTTKPDTIITDSTDNRTVYAIPEEPQPETVLINGRTKFILKVTKNKIYRLRLINMSAMALFTFKLKDESEKDLAFEVIEVEGMLVKRREKIDPFKFLRINSAQRYSILFDANQDGNVYGMNFYAKGCHRVKSFTQNITGTIRYDDASVAKPPKNVPQMRDCDDYPPMKALIPYCDNNSNPSCGKSPPKNNGNTYKMNIILDTLLYDGFKIDNKDPWKQNVAGYLSHDLKPYWDHKWSNNITSNTFLEVLKLSENKKPRSWDSTLNVINLKEPNKVHDIIFKNIDKLEHPIHLHGHFFYVLGFNIGNRPLDPPLDEENPIQRDTITVPPGGWAQIRFVVDNPGVWPMHCHIDWHLGVGMLAQFVELGRSDVAKIYTEDSDNKPPKEWCDACTGAKNIESYCRNKNKLV